MRMQGVSCGTEGNVHRWRLLAGETDQPGLISQQRTPAHRPNRPTASDGRPDHSFDIPNLDQASLAHALSSQIVSCRTVS
jgi:hypothetical protein